MTTAADDESEVGVDGLRALIEKVWGYSELRPLQEPAMRAMLEGRDSLTVLPTGGGKSLCYQAPALLLSEAGRGPTVVISPLIALMKDQVDSLRSLGVAAAQLDSSLSADDRRAVAHDLRSGNLHLLYVSPERLIGGGEGFQQMLRNAGVGRFAIDEAHCISAWGHDFRPEYRQLAHLKEMFPGASVHGFTATATEAVREDIANQLALIDPEVLVGNFDRPNLTYRILPRRDMFKQIEEILARHKNEAGIIYCLRRKDVDEVTAVLNETKGLGRKALAYHAGLSPEQRKNAQDAFIEEEADLIVATIAFGMGIDRSNIRFVLHAGMPKSIEAYQQETGRAGRDGLEAECILLYSAQDVMTWKFIIEKSAQDARAKGTPVAEDFVPNALEHIDRMDRFARGATCAIVPSSSISDRNITSPRWTPKMPMRGQPSPQAAAHAIIAWAIPRPVKDATVLAQKILSAVARTGERFGAGQILAVLRGANTERVRQFGHDKLPTYGLLRELEESEIRDYIYQLIGQGALGQENLILSNGRSAPILKLTKASVAVLKGQREVRLVQIVRKSASEARKTRGEEISWEGVDHDLFDALRGLRKQLATERNVPPYVILSDATLREFARIRPTNPGNFRLVYGIGENKLKDLGPKFIPFIAVHCQAKGLATDVFARTAPVRMEPAPAGLALAGSRREAAKLFREGASIAEVAQQMGRAASTVTQYLADYIHAERPASISPWVTNETYATVKAASEKLQTDRLKVIFMELGEKVPYDQIRLVMAHLAK